jgi:DNA polymerase/3'-5' exonuclease PolX
MNSLIVSNLQKLATQAKSRGETYRAQAFEKASNIISGLTYEIKDSKQLKGIPGIGKGIMDRVQELLETKHLKEVDTMDKRAEVIDEFTKIMGVGVKTAEKWYNKGDRSLKDIKAHEKLSHAQAIGMKYIDELGLKIPRANITAIEGILQKAVAKVNKQFGVNIILTVAGSYRRKLPESGDIDVLVTETGGRLNEKHINAFLDNLTTVGLITDDISLGNFKYAGICLDKDGIHRRIDFEFVRDYDSYPYELLYFTGSYNFNIIMRQRAKEKNMMLNQNGLYKGGILVPVKSEKEIFEILGMKYLEPEQRI